MISSLLQYQQETRGVLFVSEDGKTLEVLSRALKSFLEYVLECCVRECELESTSADEKGEIVITQQVLTRVLQKYPWILSPDSSLSSV